MDFRPVERLNARTGNNPLALPVSKLTTEGIQRLCSFLHFESGMQFKPISTRNNGDIDAIVSVKPIRSTGAAYIAFSKKVEAGSLRARQAGQYDQPEKIIADLHRECLIIDSVSGRMMGLPNLDPPAPDTKGNTGIAYMHRRRDQRPH